MKRIVKGWELKREVATHLPPLLLLYILLTHISNNIFAMLVRTFLYYFCHQKVICKKSIFEHTYKISIISRVECDFENFINIKLFESWKTFRVKYPFCDGRILKF